MAETHKVRVYKYKNIAAALAVVLLVVVGISTSCNSNGKKHDDKKKDTSSSASSSVSDKNDSGDDASDSVVKLTKNYRYDEYKNGSSLNNGSLVIVNSEHPFTGEIPETDGVYNYLFDRSGNQIMYATSTLINGSREMLESFNAMGVDFSNETGLKTLMVSGLIPESGEEGDPKTDEAYSGVKIDLMLYDAVNGTYPEFTGEGDYSWLSENCYKYGFVGRGTNGFRYVGVPYAEYMHENSLGFEDFSEKVKEYTFEKPLLFDSQQGVRYAVYFVKADLESTVSKIPIPLRDDNTEYNFSVSGNNVDGYVVCVDLTGEAAPVGNGSSQIGSDDGSSAAEEVQ